MVSSVRRIGQDTTENAVSGRPVSIFSVVIEFRLHLKGRLIHFGEDGFGCLDGPRLNDLHLQQISQRNLSPASFGSCLILSLNSNSYQTAFDNVLRGIGQPILGKEDKLVARRTTGRDRWHRIFGGATHVVILPPVI